MIHLFSFNQKKKKKKTLPPSTHSTWIGNSLPLSYRILLVENTMIVHEKPNRLVVHKLIDRPTVYNQLAHTLIEIHPFTAKLAKFRSMYSWVNYKVSKYGARSCFI